MPRTPPDPRHHHFHFEDLRAPSALLLAMEGRAPWEYAALLAATPVDLLLLGIGSRPDTALAEACGLDCQDGIVVDAQMRSSDPDILALGDAVRFTPAGGGATLRLESVQNANDQAKTVAATLAGRNEPYAALPWFWSEQGSMRLQMAGLMPADGERHRRPGATLSSFSVLHYLGGQLRCVESVNAPMDHMAARKLLETGKTDLLENFVSNKTRRKFKAFLAFDKKEGKVSFEFEPRAAKVPAKKAAAKKAAKA